LGSQNARATLCIARPLFSRWPSCLRLTTSSFQVLGGIDLCRFQQLTPHPGLGSLFVAFSTNHRGSSEDDGDASCRFSGGGDEGSTVGCCMRRFAAKLFVDRDHRSSTPVFGGGVVPHQRALRIATRGSKVTRQKSLQQAPRAVAMGTTRATMATLRWNVSVESLCGGRCCCCPHTQTVRRHR